MIFVTGGTGFLGGYILKNLVEKGLPVRALRRSTKPLPLLPAWVFEKVDWVEGDVLDVVSLAAGMQNCNSVMHAAAVVSYDAADREAMYKTNVEGTANVVNAAIDAGLQRLVHVSSIAAIGRSGNEETVNEDHQWQDADGETHYGITKHFAELEVFRGFAEGLQGCLINPSLILGFGDWHQSSSAIFKSLYSGFPWYTNNSNGYVGVADVAEVAVQLLQSQKHQQRYIVSAENRSLQSVFNTIADDFNKPRPSRLATPFMGEIAWRMEKLKSLFTKQKPLLTKETARIAHAHTAWDNRKILEALPGFQFQPIDDVIRDACTRYKQALAAGILAQP